MFFAVLVDMLREHKTIILGPKKKPRMNMVAIDDEEFEEKIISEASQEVIVEGEITELVNEAMEKYCFQNQVEETIKHLGTLLSIVMPNNSQHDHFFLLWNR